jgi:hypothetical protein
MAAIGYYTVTAAVDPADVVTDFEAEADITNCEAVGSPGQSTSVVLVTGETLASSGAVIFVVTGADVSAITDAATAVGGVEVAAGYPAVA